MDELQKTKTESKKLAMESTAFSSSSCASFESDKNVEKSFLDLSNFNKTSYTKQKSINNTNEVFNFFTNITNNQKDLSKKYEQLFTLIKKHGKELKYLLAKSDEHNNLLSDTNKYVQKVKEHLCDAAYERTEQIERNLHEDNNNIDIMTRLIVHILKTVEIYHSTSEECNIEIKRLKKNVQNFLNKADYSNLERQLTIKNEELKREFTSNVNILKEQQELKTKIQSNASNYRQDIKTIYSKLIYFIYQFFMYNKNYKQKKIILHFWLCIAKVKKKCVNTIINFIHKKKLYLLIYSFQRLKNNCYETALMERVLTLINNRNTNIYSGNDDGNRKSNWQLFPNIAKARNMESKLNYAKLESIYNSEKKKSIGKNVSSYNSNKLKQNENSYPCENYNDTLKIGETHNTYTNSFSSKAKDTAQFEEEAKSVHSFSDTFRESDTPLKNYMDKYINQINSKADKKSVDALYQTIKKLNYKLNEVKNSLEIQKKINEELMKFVPKETKDYINKKLNNTYFKNEGDRSSTIFEGDRKNSVLELNKINSLLETKRKSTMFDDRRKNSTHDITHRTLSEFILNHRPSKKISLTDNSHVKSVLKKKDEESESNIERKREHAKYKQDSQNGETPQRNRKYDSLYRKDEFSRENEKNMHRNFLESLEKMNNDTKFSKNNTTVPSTNNNAPFYHDTRSFKDTETFYAKEKTCDKKNTSKQRANSRINKIKEADIDEKINKNNAFGKVNRQAQNNSDRENMEKQDEHSTISNIDLCLRTGGGFRKLSEQDKNRFLQKMNYLHGNNLLGYETNLNIKIKAPALLKNIPYINQHAFKKEKRHRSLSTFHNMY